MRTVAIVAAGVLPLLAACQSTVSFPGARLDEVERPPRQVTGYFARPEGKGPFPAVVILHACGGVLQHVNAGWLDYLKSIGYAALAVDTFGNNARCPDPRWRDAWRFVEDAYGALDYLARLPEIDGDRVAVMGFSIGAMHVSNTLVPSRVRKAGQRDFRAAIAFYGLCRPYSLPPQDAIPLLLVIAEKDQHTYSAGCPDWAKPGRRIELRVLAGAYHAFDSLEYSGRVDDAGNEMRYSAEATREARRHARAFLDAHLR
jgi:dienelactone hydrolase